MIQGRLISARACRRTAHCADLSGELRSDGKNEFVIRLIGRSRTIAANEAKAQTLLSTLIEACASNRRGLAISNEEQSDV